MFVLVPLGSDQSVRRLPWFTIVVMAICVVVQIHETIVGTSDFALQEAAERAQVACREDPQSCPDQLARLDHLDDKTFAHQYAFHAARPSLIDALTSAFIHGGWLHLIGNMLFLWLIGCNLEDRWGPLPFAALYLLGAVAAAYAFSAAHPHSAQTLIGASGAIAAGMGAFVVTHHGASIRIGYLSFGFRFRTGQFWAPAWVAFPVWFLLQLVFALQEGDFTTVGYSAHVGGFVFGLAATFALRATGVEKHFIQSTDAIDETPHEQDLKSAAALGHRAVVEPALVPEIDRLSRARRYVDLCELYTLVEKHMADMPVSDRALAQVIHAAAEQKDVDCVERAMRRMVVEHRESALIPKALWDTAQAQLAANRRAEGRRTLEDLVARYPMDPIADEAKRQLA